MVCTQRAIGVVLYDALQETTPSSQDWLYLSDPFLGADATVSMQPEYVFLDSTPEMSDQAGFFSWGNSELPFMNRHDTYRIRFDVQVLSESHSGQDRAGFSVIVLSDDSVGVELAFWEDEIWAQTDTPLFTHGEGVPFDTTAAIEQYDLFVVGDRYALWAGGTPILTGPLRDYTAHSHPVYQSDMFLFFGDDTSQAAAELALAYIEGEDDPRPPMMLGDMNGDQQVSAEDISPFVMALTDADEYFAQYPLVEPDLFGDINQDGFFNLGDIAQFKTLIGSPAAVSEAFAAVPEPSSGLVLTLLLFLLAPFRRDCKG